MITKIKIFVLFALDILVPRFITEDVAMSYSGSGARSDWENYDIECSMIDVQPEEIFDGVATVDSFQFFGLGITYRIGNFRTWQEAGR